MVSSSRGWRSHVLLVLILALLGKVAEPIDELLKHFSGKEAERTEEHDPCKCGCRYQGQGMWSCGHIDNLPW